jgi:hypothetical protein
MTENEYFGFLRIFRILDEFFRITASTVELYFLKHRKEIDAMK